jgi:hypothetical protein
MIYPNMQGGVRCKQVLLIKAVQGHSILGSATFTAELEDGLGQSYPPPETLERSFTGQGLLIELIWNIGILNCYGEVKIEPSKR